MNEVTHATWQVLEPLAQGVLPSCAPVGVAQLPHPTLRLYLWFTPEAMGLVAPCCNDFDPVNGLMTDSIVCFECRADLRFSRAFFLGSAVTHEAIETWLATYKSWDPLETAYMAGGLMLDYEQWKERHPLHADA